MPTPSEILEQQQLRARLQREGQKVAWALNSTVYELEGARWLLFALQEHERKPWEGPFRVVPLPPEWGADPYVAMGGYLDDFRGFKKR